MGKLLRDRYAARLCATASIVGAAILAMPGAVRAGSFETVHAFPECSGGSCREGSAPGGNLAMDSAGNFYGTTAQGGKNGVGTIFQLTPDGSGGWHLSTIYSFCSEDDCADGAVPQATLIIDSAGNLYGTTQGGGEQEGSGVGFKLQHSANGWELIVIHNFCGVDAHTPDDDCMGGATPAGGFTYAGATAGLPYDGESPLYGASTEGGEGEAGIIYELKPRKDGARGKDKEEWRVKELYVFCAPAPEEDGNCDDGKMPSGRLLVDARGRLYGTTYYGGEDANYDGGGGVVFELAYDRKAKTWGQIVLYKFCSQRNCRDGRAPYGGLIADAAGNLFGATEAGGQNCNAGQNNCGVVFMISPNGENSVSRVLHTFCTANDCADGATPRGEMAIDASGNLFGAALNGGADKGGIVYRLEPDGKLRALHTFCGTKDCAGARYPNGVVMDGSGGLLGVASAGGKKGGGAVFRIAE